jgi:hypothetical protein
MKKRIAVRFRRILCIPLLLLTAAAAFARSPNSYQITPDNSTMLIGESRTFRMVDQDGHAQTKVTWTLSDVDAFESIEGDQVQLIPKRAGDFRLAARTDFATAEATVKVVEGASLPTGTVRWSSGGKKGCRSVKIIPAVPVPNGPHLFEQSVCEDGEYIAAYTADGVQLWRRKLSDHGALAETAGNSYETVGNRLEPHSTSVCDSVAVGTDQQKIRELLNQRSLTFREEPAGGRIWMVDESNSQCQLSFDEKLVLAKKRKVFVAD